MARIFTAKLMDAAKMNMLLTLMRSIHGVTEEGPAMLMALRKKVMLTKV